MNALTSLSGNARTASVPNVWRRSWKTTRSSFSRTRFYAALREAGLGHLREKEDRVVFHDLRHTFGTLAVRAFPLSDVKAFMGHESIDTTMIYVHHIPQTDAAARLSALLSGESVRRETGLEDLR